MNNIIHPVKCRSAATDCDGERGEGGAGCPEKVEFIGLLKVCAAFHLRVQDWHDTCNNIYVDAHSISYARLLAS